MSNTTNIASNTSSPQGNTSHKKKTRITEPRNNDYDNDGSDNCDYNFGTFDDFGVKSDQKVSLNMILMSRYKGQ